MTAPAPSAAPCGSCPYRRDVPSGIWTADEYAKLPAYDGSTIDQLLAGAFGLFFCHQNDGTLCAGWTACHDRDHLLAARMNPVDPSFWTYQSPVPLFGSGEEAAAHGLRDVADPGPEAKAMIAKLAARQDSR